jgi:TetR/AcrR family transcriptional repressor of nem operon
MPKGATSKDEIARYCGLFRSAFVADGRACLCGILSNEAALLPEQVKSEVAAFAQANVTWLEILFAGESSEVARRKARFIYAAMQGAMGVSSLNDDVGWLDDVADCIYRGVLR